MTTKNRYFIIGITALLLCFAVIFFTRKKNQEEAIFIYAVPLKTEWGWGYKIYRGNNSEKDTTVDKAYIRQDYIPGIPGKQGFKSPDDALRVANLIITRISSNQMPTITGKDLDSLGLAH